MNSLGCCRRWEKQQWKLIHYTLRPRSWRGRYRLTSCQEVITISSHRMKAATSGVIVQHRSCRVSRFQGLRVDAALATCTGSRLPALAACTGWIASDSSDYCCVVPLVVRSERMGHFASFHQLWWSVTSLKASQQDRILFIWWDTGCLSLFRWDRVLFSVRLA